DLSMSSEAAQFLNVELYQFARYRDPDACIARFVQLVRRLPPSTRRLWDDAAQRRFDIGLEGASSGTPFTARLETSTLRNVAEVDGEIAITIYAPPRRARPRSKR